MSAPAHLHEQIKKLFLEKLNLEISSIDTDLVEEGFLDSLQFVQLLLHLEQEFQRRFSLEDLEIENFRSIARIANYVNNRQ